MSRRGPYAVRISGLADGDHDFQFVLDQKFFATLEHPEIENGNVSARITLEKKPGVLSLCFKLTGEVEVVCDRCLEPFMTEIDTTQTIFVKEGDEPGEIEDNVVMIHKDDHEIEVGQFMYEYIVLALPLQRMHPDDEQGVPACDPDMIKHLDAHRGIKDLKDQTDPRWDALKGIIEKNK